MLTYITNIITFKLPFEKLIVVNDGTYGDKAAAYFGVPERRFAFHPHVINKKSASFSPPDALSRDMGFSLHDRIVMFASRHTRSKRLDIVINAMALVIKNEPRARLLIIGDGPTRTMNEELAKRLGIHEYVRFVGSVRHVDVWQYYRIAHVFLSTNTLSNLCLPAVESMACGVPVVALDIRGTGELVKDGITGFLVQRKSDNQTCEEMANVVCRLLRDPDLHKRIADTGRAFALRNFPDWNDRIKEHIHLIESLVHPNPAIRNRSKSPW
jgi:glycosyltransferase involved in cell wall biosynthesis